MGWKELHRTFYPPLAITLSSWFEFRSLRSLTRDFRLHVFSWFFHDSGTLEAISNFYEKSRRYLQLRFYRRFQQHWQYKNLSPVNTTPAWNSCNNISLYIPQSEYLVKKKLYEWKQQSDRISSKLKKTLTQNFSHFIAGVVDTGDQPLPTNIYAKFRKIFKLSQWYTQGKLIREKKT